MSNNQHNQGSSKNEEDKILIVKENKPQEDNNQQQVPNNQQQVPNNQQQDQNNQQQDPNNQQQVPNNQQQAPNNQQQAPNNQLQNLNNQIQDPNNQSQNSNNSKRSKISPKEARKRAVEKFKEKREKKREEEEKLGRQILARDLNVKTIVNNAPAPANTEQKSRSHQSIIIEVQGRANNSIGDIVETENQKINEEDEEKQAAEEKPETEQQETPSTTFCQNMDLLIEILFCMFIKNYLLVFSQFRKGEIIRIKWYNFIINLHLAIFYIWFFVMGVTIQLLFFVPHIFYFFVGMFWYSGTRRYHSYLTAKFEEFMKVDGYMEYVFYLTGGYAFLSFMVFFAVVVKNEEDGSCCTALGFCFVGNFLITIYWGLVSILHQIMFVIGNIPLIWMLFVPSMTEKYIGVARWKEGQHYIARNLVAYAENLFYALAGMFYMYFDNYYRAKYIEAEIIIGFDPDEVRQEVWARRCAHFLIRSFSLFFIGVIFQMAVLLSFITALIVELFYPKGFAIIFCSFWPADCYYSCSDCFHEACPYVIIV